LTPLLEARAAASAAVRCPYSRAMAASRSRNVAFDHKSIDRANMFDHPLNGFGIAHDDQLLSSLRRPEDSFRFDRFAAVERDRPKGKSSLT
jgi:hypothetical protein